MFFNGQVMLRFKKPIQLSIAGNRAHKNRAQSAGRSHLEHVIKMVV
jgi:hypothetical protein